MQKEEKLQLDAQERKVFGKKLKKLRREGQVPGNIYGPDFKSQAVTLALKDFRRIYKTAQETGIVYLRLGKQELPVLIKNVQSHPVSDSLLHVDFRKIDLKQKIETQVPVKIMGESSAVEQKAGVLLTQVDEITVEALPENIPHVIEVDVSKLNEIGDEIKISGLPKSDKFEIKEETDKTIVSVIAHKEESLVAETATKEPEIIEEVKEGEEAAVEEGAEAAPPAEGEKPKEKPEQQKAEQTKEKPPEVQKPSSAKAPEGKPEKK